MRGREMKEGWEYKKLKEVGLTQTGTTPSKQIRSFYGGDIPFIRPAELNVDQNGGIQYNSELKLTEEGALKSRVIKANSVLMCCIGSVGKTGFTFNNVTCNQQINTLTPYDDYNPRFVYYALISPIFQQKVIKIANSAKATLPIISKGKWEVLEIPVPPLSEQQSIVDYLDSTFAKIDAMKANAEKALNEAKALFQASLKEMLEPKEGWEEKAIKDFATDLYRGSGVKREQVTKEGISCVRYGEIYTKYNYHFNECNSHTLAKYVNSPKYFEHGDILFAITGESVEEIGKSIAYTGNEKCIAGGDIVVMKHNYEPRYISYALSTPSSVKQKGHGKTKLKVVHTNIPSLKEIIIPIAPINEQSKIADTLDSLKSKVDRLQANYDKISQECDALKQAILRQVFE